MLLREQTCNSVSGGIILPIRFVFGGCLLTYRETNINVRRDERVSSRAVIHTPEPQLLIIFKTLIYLGVDPKKVNLKYLLE